MEETRFHSFTYGLSITVEMKYSVVVATQTQNVLSVHITENIVRVAVNMPESEALMMLIISREM